MKNNKEILLECYQREFEPCWDSQGKKIVKHWELCFKSEEEMTKYYNKKLSTV